MRGPVADQWHAADEAGKRAMLALALETNCPLDIELLDEETKELDRLALPLGLVPVYIAAVGGDGLSYRAPGVVSPGISDRYHGRRVKKVHTDLDILLEQCALILERAGKDVKSGRVCGYIGVPARVYKDDKMTVHQVLAPHAEAGLFELVLYYDRAQSPYRTNPVIMRGADGAVFRSHGEWTMLKEHVATVAAQLKQAACPEPQAAAQPLGLEDAVSQLQAIADATYARPRTLSVRIFNPGGMSAHQTVDVAGLNAGFDWEGGEVILTPSAPLTRLSPEQVAAIQESVKGGSSWHAYAQQKKLRERIKELEAQVAALQANQAGD